MATEDFDKRLEEHREKEVMKEKKAISIREHILRRTREQKELVFGYMDKNGETQEFTVRIWARLPEKISRKYKNMAKLLIKEELTDEEDQELWEALSRFLGEICVSSELNAEFWLNPDNYSNDIAGAILTEYGILQAKSVIEARKFRGQ